eukprot:TRINITY_DN35233_c1_g2_i1.p1 TRINITY_DN35233_c1_g2~~TRINITY_DN35233_c1_g2_i1.p1  ORF type:complete len:106 (-),score=2.35 TRINITY_DN35233_c1_g2_i1:54-371(-)
MNVIFTHRVPYSRDKHVLLIRYLLCFRQGLEIWREITRDYYSHLITGHNLRLMISRRFLLEEVSKTKNPKQSINFLLSKIFSSPESLFSTLHLAFNFISNLMRYS